MKVWPAIDLFEGKVVRLTRGEFSARTDYAENPLAVARSFISAGCRRLHVVDLEGAKLGEPCHAELLPDLSALGLTIRYGGGLRSADAIERVLLSGASFAMVGSLLFSSPKTQDELYERFGERIIPAVDVKCGRVCIRGWTEELEFSPRKILEELLSAGFRQTLVTAVDRDGTGMGPDLDLYRGLLAALPGMAFTAAGGIAAMEDLKALEKMGVSDAVVGKALYEGTLPLERALEVERPC